MVVVNVEGSCKHSAVSSQVSSIQIDLASYSNLILPTWVGLSIYPKSTGYEKNCNFSCTVPCKEMTSLYSLCEQKEAGLLSERTCFRAAIGECGYF